MAKVCTSYSKYFNKKYNLVGHIFQDQFKAVLVDSDSYFLWLSAYIHQNPKVAGLVSDLHNYPWSSYLDYAGLRNGQLSDKTILLGMMPAGGAYSVFVENSFEYIKARKDFEHLLLD
jgi:hypothetical protein